MKKNKNLARTIILAAIVGIFLLLILAVFKQNPQELPQKQSLKTHTSQDLKISFQYPEGWHVDEKDRSILIASYVTNIGKGSTPNKNQIKMFIDEFSGCHRDIEENLKDPACGEGGLSVAKNEIVSKEVKQTKEGIFYRYIVRTPKGNKLAYYLLEKGDKILQISKHPDPSQFEKEFEEIVNSIEFL